VRVGRKVDGRIVRLKREAAREAVRIELDVQLIDLGNPKKQKTLGGEMGRVVSDEGGYGTERARAVNNVDESFLVI